MTTAAQRPAPPAPKAPPSGLAPHAVVGLVLVALFMAMALDFRRDGVSDFDETVITWVRAFDSPQADDVMRAVTMLGEGMAAGVVFGLTALLSARLGGNRRLSLIIVAAAVTATVLNFALKSGFARARPTLFFEIDAPSTASFPSGHALLATVSFGMAAIVINRVVPSRRLRTVALVVAPVLALLVGTSRIYLGVHWPTDVVAGFALGGLILLAVLVVLRRV